MSGPEATERAHWFALHLANSTGCAACRGGDALVSVTEARRWVRRRLPGETAPRDREELNSLRRFRTQLRQLFQNAADGVPPARASLVAVNQAAASLASHPELRWSRGHWKVEQEGGEGVVLHRLEALAARSAIELVAGPRPTTIRRCDGPGCAHFLAARTRQQRWCSSSGCGNRVRVQRHYQKLRSLRPSARSPTAV